MPYMMTEMPDSLVSLFVLPRVWLSTFVSYSRRVMSTNHQTLGWNWGRAAHQEVLSSIPTNRLGWAGQFPGDESV